MRRQIGGLEPRTRQRNTEITWTKNENWENGTVDVRPAGLFRFYAGQVDPKDPSHFTIDYALDGQRNTIDGYLKSGDQLLVVPRVGRIVDQDARNTFVWDPFAAPATQPTKP